MSWRAEMKMLFAHWLMGAMWFFLVPPAMLIVTVCNIGIWFEDKWGKK